MARYTQVVQGPGGRPVPWLDREGLYHWYMVRFPGDQSISEETLRTESPAKLRQMLIELSRKTFPEATHDDIDAALRDAYAGADRAEESDAQELAAWMREHVKAEVTAEEIVGLSFEQARSWLWNAYDQRYRPEMRRMERSLLLNQLDSAWKNHLLTMDHLRQGIGLVGYAQIDPK